MSIENWEEVNLDELCTIKTGDKDVNEGNVNGKYPFFTCAQDISFSDDYSFDGQAILIAGNGNFNVKKFDGKFEAYQRTYVLQDFKIDFKYLYYFILSRLSDITKDNRGSTIRYIRVGDLSNYPVPFPSINEQYRIVNKIEMLLPEVQSGIDSLILAKRQLELYRQSLLKSAFEGKLTAKWREDYAKYNGKPLPSTDELLQHIQDARKAHYEQQVEDWKQAVLVWEKEGRNGRKPIKPSKPYQFNYSVKDNNLYIKLGSIIEKPKYGTSQKCDYIETTNTIGVLRIPNISSNGNLDLTDIKFTEFKDNEADEYRLIKDDILIIRSNGSPSIVGRSARVTEKDLDYIYAGYLIRLRPIAELVDSQFLNLALKSLEVRKQIESKAKSTSGVNNINAKEIQSLELAYFSLQEQTLIVEILDEKLNLIERFRELIENQLKKSELLKTSILHKAFKGNLVPQDPNDPPASELLTQINAEREAKAKAEKEAKAQAKLKNKPKSKSKSKAKKAPKKVRSDTTTPDAQVSEQISLPL